MKERISANAIPTSMSLHDVVCSDLSYKIAIKSQDYVDQFPGVFELGQCEYRSGIDTLLDHILVGNVGLSEMTTIGRNNSFLTVFDACCNFELYRDQVDSSSLSLKRPDDTVVANGAVCFKEEAKGNRIDVEVARLELTDKFSPDAIRLFPSGSHSIFGMTTFPHIINLYAIRHTAAGAYTTDLITAFDMRQLDERVRFVKAVFKMAEWMCGIKGPNEYFHLVPGVRRETPNGHHVTWTADCLLKELKLGGRRGATVALYTETLNRIEIIYAAHLPNVEWGTVQKPNELRVTRIGHVLRSAIAVGKITKDKAVEDVTKGEHDVI